MTSAIYETVDRLPIETEASQIPSGPPIPHQPANCLLVVPPHPTSRKWLNDSGYWSDMDFHEELYYRPGNQSFGMQVSLSAKGCEALLVAFSPIPGFVLGKSYAIEFGGAGNQKVAIRRRLREGGAKQVENFTGKVLSTETFNEYWLTLRGGILSAGIGSTVGHNTLCQMDDVLYDECRSGCDMGKFVGIGNAAGGKQDKGKARSKNEIEVRDVRVEMCDPDLVIEPVTHEKDLGSEDNRRRPKNFKEYIKQVCPHLQSYEKFITNFNATLAFHKSIKKGEEKKGAYWRCRDITSLGSAFADPNMNHEGNNSGEFEVKAGPRVIDIVGGRFPKDLEFEELLKQQIDRKRRFLIDEEQTRFEGGGKRGGRR